MWPSGSGTLGMLGRIPIMMGGRQALNLRVHVAEGCNIVCMIF